MYNKCNRRWNCCKCYDHKDEVLESICDHQPNKGCCESNYDNDECSCGFHKYKNVFPENPMLAQSYVPIQYLDKTFTPCCGLKNGTIFPELVSPYRPGQSMEEIEYLKCRNEIGEGCNS